jgi:enoyl-CoA hydratase/carnithine racemase
MLFTGRAIDAKEAYRIGLVNKVVPPAQLMTVAKEMAEMVCRPAPLAVRAAKQAMIQGSSLSLRDGLELEKTLTDFLVTTEDFDEGRQAFLAKRRANFKVK